jgi:hypothetical protein
MDDSSRGLISRIHQHCSSLIECSAQWIGKSYIQTVCFKVWHQKIQTTVPLLLVLKTIIQAVGAFILSHSGHNWMVFMRWYSRHGILSLPAHALSTPLIARSRQSQKVYRVGVTKNVGHASSQLALARELLHQLEIANGRRTLSSGEIWLKNSFKKHSLALASLKRTIARLRSRIGWLREGDANTKNFHLHARHRKRKNFIAKLTIKDHIYTKHEDKAALVDLFFDNLLGTSIDRETSINLSELGIPTSNLSDLDMTFTEEEIWSTIKKLPSDKAPGPNGLTGRFYKVCWPIIKHDIMVVISAVWSRKMMGFSALNTAYITLLAKKGDAEQPKNFRPISLVHNIAKLITKVLAYQLAGRLNQLVSPNQSVFIQGRFIQDNSC